MHNGSIIYVNLQEGLRHARRRPFTFAPGMGIDSEVEVLSRAVTESGAVRDFA